MVRYRRNRLQGGTYFFTVTLRDRSSDALVRHVDLLRAAWQSARQHVAHEIVAAVVLPDHLHAVLQMQDESDDYSRLWQDIKKTFTRRLGSGGSLWQPRFWEHTIRDETDLAAHVDYVHINPVKHGLVSRVVDWPHSTFHRFVRGGVLSPDWAGVVDPKGRFGERE